MRLSRFRRRVLRPQSSGFGFGCLGRLRGLFVLGGLFTLLSFVVEWSQAAELRRYYRGAREAAMGGAFVALADDEQALYLNPAGMAGTENGRIHYGVMDLEASIQSLGSIDETSKAFSNASLDNVNSLLGKNVYARATTSPTLMIPNFGIGYLFDAQVAFYARNQAQPKMTIAYQITQGVQTAFGFSVLRPRWKGQASRKPDLRIGVGAKVLWRRGGYETYPLLTFFNLSEGASLLDPLLNSIGMGIGADLGMQYLIPLSKDSKLQFGSAYTNVGDVSFKGTGNPSPIKGNFSIGTAYVYQPKWFHFKFAYDYSDILKATDWRLRNHVGMEVGLPIVTLFGGLNGTYYSYGASANIWLMKLTVANYTKELGTFLRQDPDRRVIIHLDFSFEL